MGLKWLTKVFCPYTARGSRGTRLLLVDGHSSHVNLAFLDYAMSNRIVVLVLPPHSTHRLQPLDLGLFGPLSQAYNLQMQQFMLRYQGFVSLSKRDFYGLFQEAWLASFTHANIESAWEASGIYPFNPDRTILQLKYSEGPQAPITPRRARNIRDMAVPNTIRPLRRLFRDLGPLRNNPRVRLLISASEMAMATSSIIKHENAGLREAIILLKKKKIKGKRLNVLGRDNGGAQLFGPDKIQIAKQLAITKMQANHAAVQERVTKKQLAAEKKKQAERAKAERRDNRAANAQLKADAKKQLELEKAAKKASKEADKLRKQLEQYQDSRHQKKGGGDISLTAPSTPVTSRPSHNTTMRSPIDMTVTIQSRPLKEMVPRPTSPSQALVVDGGKSKQSLIVILKLQHPSRFRHIFKKKIIV